MVCYSGPYLYVGRSIMEGACDDYNKCNTKTNFVRTAAGLLFHSAMINVKFKIQILYAPLQIVESLQKGAYGNLPAQAFALRKAITEDRFIQDKNLPNMNDPSALLTCAYYSKNPVVIVKHHTCQKIFEKQIRSQKINIPVIDEKAACEYVKGIHDKLVNGEDIKNTNILFK